MRNNCRRLGSLSIPKNSLGEKKFRAPRHVSRKTITFCIAKCPKTAYLIPMSNPFEFCIPTVGKALPSASEWFHEIKYDGYRLRVERDGGRVRLITKGGYDWSKRYPWIVEGTQVA
jgi:ATP-dependent DNA ligase